MKRHLTAFLLCLLAGQIALAAENKNFYSDGTITAGQQWYAVGVWDTPPAHTTLTMTGGLVDTLSAYNASVVNISGGSLKTLNGLQEAKLTLSGTATVETASVGMSSILNMNGGSINVLNANQQAVLNLSGGVITNMLVAYGDSVVNVFGKGLFKTSTGGPNLAGYVSGFWGDNTGFMIPLGNTEAYSHINLVTIPEPVTLLFFTAALPFVRRLHNRI